MKRSSPYYSTIFLFLGILIWGCTDEAPEVGENATFIKFFGDPDVNNVPVTLQELPDGYVLLGHVERISLTDELQPLVFRTDLQGNEIWNTTVELNRFESAVGNVNHEFKRATDTLELLDLAIGANEDYFLLHSLRIENILNDNQTSFFALTKLDRSGTQVWNKFYPVPVNVRPASFLNQNGVIKVLIETQVGMSLVEVNESGNLLREISINTEEEFPRATLFPRGMIQDQGDLVILSDGFDVNTTIRRSYFLRANDQGVVLSGNIDPIQFSESPWRLHNLIKVGTGFGARVSGKLKTSIVKYNIDQSIEWIYDIEQSSQGMMLTDNDLSGGTRNGSLLVAGTLALGNNAQMFVGLFDDNQEIQTLTFGPDNGAAYARKAIQKRDLGFAILGAYELDRNDVIVLISTDPMGKL